MKTAAPSWGAARRAAVVLGIVLVASGLTVALESLIRFAGFVFFYGAVVASAVYAGVAGGVVATIVGIIVVQHELMPSQSAFMLREPEGWAAIVAFAAVSMLVTALAQSLRVARRTAEVRAEEMGLQAAELEMQRREAQALAEELEESNVELEATTDDAKRARDSALAGEERLRLVDEASRVLTSSLDYETTVAAVARLAVPDFADWCARRSARRRRDQATRRRARRSGKGALGARSLRRQVPPRSRRRDRSSGRDSDGKGRAVARGHRQNARRVGQG